jgi:hypothetical protein
MDTDTKDIAVKEDEYMDKMLIYCHLLARTSESLRSLTNIIYTK